MQRTTGDGESEQQAAGRIFVVGIILNDFGLCSGLLDFGIANISLNGALKGMAAELEFISSKLSANVIQRFHRMASRDYSGSLRSAQHKGVRAEVCERDGREGRGSRSEVRGVRNFEPRPSAFSLNPFVVTWESRNLFVKSERDRSINFVTRPKRDKVRRET